MLHKKFNQDLAAYNLLRKKMIHVKLKVCLRFYKFLRQCAKTIHGRTHHNKICYCHMVAETITMLRLFLFSKKGNSGQKQKK